MSEAIRLLDAKMQHRILRWPMEDGKMSSGYRDACNDLAYQLKMLSAGLRRLFRRSSRSRYRVPQEQIRRAFASGGVNFNACGQLLGDIGRQVSTFQARRILANPASLTS